MPSSRSVWLQIRMPHIKRITHNAANHQPVMPIKYKTNAIGSAGSVPKVPGAAGAKPLPKPKPSKHNGRDFSHEKVGLKSLKMIES